MGIPARARAPAGISIEIRLTGNVLAEHEIEDSQIWSEGIVRVVDAAGDDLPILNARRDIGMRVLRERRAVK